MRNALETYPLLIFLMRGIFLGLAYRLLFEGIWGEAEKLQVASVSFFVITSFKQYRACSIFHACFCNWCILQNCFLEFNRRDAYYYIFKISLLKFSSAIMKCDSGFDRR